MTRHHVWRAALIGSLSLVLMGASECNVGGKAPNVEDPEKGTAQCVVAERAYNSNGTLYLNIDCNGGGVGLGPGGGVRAAVDPNEWPMCRQGAAWPGCKDQ